MKTHPFDFVFKEKIKMVVEQILHFRYGILCFMLFSLMTLHSLNGPWIGDFWEHSAVVRELAAHPLHPAHPLLLLDAPHVFYSPYTLLTALISRVFSLDAVYALTLMGLVNLCLFLVGIRLFTAAMVPDHPRKAAFYTLLLTLFLWGENAWLFSGFFHIRALGFGLPYPSTFATALGLIGLGLQPFSTEKNSRLKIAAALVIGTIIFISHPISWLFFAVGLLSQAWVEKKYVPSKIFKAALFLILTVLTAALWPYYSLLNLFLSEFSVYHGTNFSMYEDVWTRVWPALIGLPLFLHKIKSERHSPAAWMLLIFLLFYGFGALSQRYTFGRVASFIVLMLHVILADYLSQWESWLKREHGWGVLARSLIPAGVIVAVLALSWSPLSLTLEGAIPLRRPEYQSFQFLSRLTGPYEVILSDKKTSWMVPTFGGKVVAADHPLAFIPDQVTRQRDVARFFNENTTISEQEEILQKYDVDYLLLNKKMIENWHSIQQTFEPLGKVIYEDQSFVLISFIPDS